MKHVDQQGNTLGNSEVTYPQGSFVNGTYKTNQLDIPGYKFIGLDTNGAASGISSLPANGTLTNVGNNGTVVYVYAPAYTQTSKTVNETINYVDKNGNVVAPKSTANPITFVTVTNPVDGSTKTYYSTTNTTATLDNNGGLLGDSWTAADNADFAAVTNPTVAGYKVISNQCAS